MSKQTPPIPLERIGSVLVIRRNRIGDMIYTLPLLKALRRALPEAQIKILTEQAGAPIAEASGVVDEVITLKNYGGRWLSLFFGLPKIRGANLAIAVRGGFDQFLAWTTKLSGATYRIGFAENGAGTRDFFYTHPIEAPSVDEHQADRCARLLEPLGISEVPLDLALSLPSDVVEFGRNFADVHHLNRHRFFVVLNLSQPRPEKWPLAKYKELGARCISAGIAVGLSALPEEKRLAFVMASELGSNSALLLETPTPLHFAAVLKYAQALIGLEGGAGHLAAAMGVPSVLLWPPYSNTKKWEPRGVPNINLWKEKGVKDISVDEVWDALRVVLSSKGITL